MKKRIVGLAGWLAVAVVLGMTSCGGDGGTTGASSSTGGHGGSNPVTTATTTGGGNGGSGGSGGAACVPEQCPPPSNECVDAACDDAGKCTERAKTDGTLAATQTAEDCLKAVCTGGVVTSEKDDADVADDGNDCTDDVCAAGAPEHPAKAIDTACGAGGALFCDGSGKCVGCNTPAQCPGVDDECQSRSCESGVCGTTFTPQGTVSMSQTMGDCTSMQCDGQGTIEPVADPGDPEDDGNPCTDDTCSGTSPVHTPTLVQTACGVGLKCDGAGQCVGCIDATDCPVPGNACIVATCVAGMCGTADKANGTACDDGNACSQSDTCQAGACTGANPVVCAAANQCSVAGVCDPATGVCSNPLKADGAACNDGNACTQSDTCQAGACTGASPVACAAPDQCHTLGVCNPATGVCSNPLKADGVACSDGNACTQTDTCQAGVCTGANPVVCAALDQCHTAGACNVATGVCSNPNKANGVACNDGDACTQTDTCQAGACTGANPVVCAAPDQCHTLGVCNAATGVCSNPNKANGAACNDGDACTQTDTCQAGACTGANPVVCAALDQCHTAGACNAATGVCSNPNKANGVACNDGDACTQTDTCQAGTCTGGNPVVCAAPDQCHNAGVCNAATGVCSNPNKANGTACNDGNACTQTDTCQAGACTGGNPVVCAALDQCHNAGVCNAATGVCSNPNKANGVACNDGNACTQTDTCQAGACTGANPVVCAASDQCHNAGVCNVATGVCSNPNKANGTACNDGDGCTQTDTCQAGTCTGGNPVVCAALDQCHNAGVCNAATGMCSNPNKANGTACNDGDACTQTDTCQVGTCTGANPVVCSAIDQCHVAGACNGATGVCSNPNQPDGTACTLAALPGICGNGACSICGNGVTEGNEACDDNNLTPCDGCSPKCEFDTTVTYATAPGLNAAIVDNAYNGTQPSMTCVNIVVPAAGDGVVDYVCPTIGMAHSWVGDLTIKLFSPSGTAITLMSMPGVFEPADDGTGVGGDSSNLLATFPITWKDGGPKSAELMGNTLISTGVVCKDDMACVYDPNNGAAAPGKLVSFVGQAGPGTWKLCIGDSGAGDLGSIDQIKLVIGQ